MATITLKLPLPTRGVLSALAAAQKVSLERIICVATDRESQRRAKLVAPTVADGRRHAPLAQRA